MLTVLLSVIGAAMSVGLTIFQLDTQEKADARTEARLQQIVHMQNQQATQQKRILQEAQRTDQHVRAQSKQVASVPPPLPLARPARTATGTNRPALAAGHQAPTGDPGQRHAPAADLRATPKMGSTTVHRASPPTVASAEQKHRMPAGPLRLTWETVD